MNKQLIKQIADKVDAWFEEDGHSKSGAVWNEKFTELLILECERVSKNPKWFSNSPSDGWRNPINHVCNTVKEHFGIK